ncbi:MAG: NAD(+)/NADH kinase [Verrucomicrobia bacterium]|nr:NAD(+)/NADH kinase [Verrucomicrobiota bacterium]
MALRRSPGSKRIRKVVVCLRRGRPGNGGVAMVLKEILREAGVRAVWTSEDGLKRAAGRGVDAMVVGGGDGTMLHAAQATMGSGIPILGINLGALGFLTSVKAEEIGYVLPKIFSGQYGLSTRSVLSAKLEGSGRSWCALNEISVAPAPGSLMVRVRVKVGGEFLSEYHADGLLVASPTGSTAYSLSAGGPLVSPRAVVVGEQEGVELSLGSTEKAALLRVDGVLAGKLTPGKVLRVTVAKPVVRLMHPAGTGFYGLARQKLGWSGSTARGGR